MYKIYFDGKRFNKKLFTSYEEARQYVRRKITATWGKYSDVISSFGFTIAK